MTSQMQITKKLSQEEIENLSSPMSIKEIDFTI